MGGAVGDHRRHEGRKENPMDAHGGGLHIFWFPLLVLFWIVAVPKLRQALGRRSVLQAASPGTSGTLGTPAPGDDDPALTILRERFARGEIDRTEYEERRNTLLRQFPGDTDSWPA